MGERLRKEVIEEKFFPGIFGENIPAEIGESPQFIDYYRKACANWADGSNLPREHRQVVIDAGEKRGKKGHFVIKRIVYLPPPRI